MFLHGLIRNTKKFWIKEFQMMLCQGYLESRYDKLVAYVINICLALPPSGVKEKKYISLYV